MDSALALALIEVAGLRGLNFRKGPFAIAKRWVEHKQNLVRTGILAAVVLLFALVNISLDFYGKQQKLDTLSSQVNQILKQSFPDVKPGKDIRAQIRKKKDNALRASLSPDLSAGNHRMIDVLNEISTRIDKQIDVVFTQLVIGEGNVLISGNTGTFNSVDSMKSQLERAKMFETVTIVSSNKDKSGERIRFKLKLQL